MKKLTALAVACTVFATSANAAIALPEVDAAVLSYGAAALIVGGTIISDGKADGFLPTTPVKTEKCNAGDTLTAGLCYKQNGTKIVVVSSGTGTATTTIRVPVFTTYKPTLS